MLHTMKALLASIAKVMPLWLFWLLAGLTALSCLVALVLIFRLLMRRARRGPVMIVQGPETLPDAPGGSLRCYRLDAVEALAGSGILQLLVSPSGVFAISGLAVSGRLSGQARGESWRLAHRGEPRQSLPNPLLACRAQLPKLAQVLGVAPDKLHPCVLVAATARWSSSSECPVGVYFSAAELIGDVRQRLNVVFSAPERQALLARLDVLLKPAELAEPVTAAPAKTARHWLRRRQPPPPVQAG